MAMLCNVLDKNINLVELYLKWNQIRLDDVFVILYDRVVTSYLQRFMKLKI